MPLSKQTSKEALNTDTSKSIDNDPDVMDTSTSLSGLPASNVDEGIAASASSSSSPTHPAIVKAMTNDAPSIKRARRHSTRTGDNTENDLESDSRPGSMRTSSSESVESEPQQTAADKPSMPPPEQAGRLAPKGYKMNPPPTDRPVRVYADGVFDLFHLGHMRQLEQAKKAFPNTYLLVGIPNDVETHKRKGLTVLDDKERAETLRHCKWVDEVIEDAPWIVTPAFLEEHNIDYVAHDDEPYASADTDDIYKPCKEAGKFLVTQRTEGISTTYIITKIVRDYEKYISRQLKRGTTRQELNVSWLKKNELDIKRHVTELRETIKNNWSTTGKELRDEFKNYWAPTPRPSSPNQTEFPGFGSPPQRPVGSLDLSRSQSANNEFAAGYSLGLVGGIRSWMRARAIPTTPGPHSMAASEIGSDDDDSPLNQSPKSEAVPTLKLERRATSPGNSIENLNVDGQKRVTRRTSKENV